MCDFDNIKPCLIEDIECIRKLQTFTVKKIQFLESTGNHTITEPDGITIRKVLVSGMTHMKDITQYMRSLFKEQPNCPLDKIVIDTGKINEYTQGDIECKTRKIIQVEYMYNDVVIEEKKRNRVEIDDEILTRTFDPTSCDEPIPEYIVTGHSKVYLINKGKCGKKDDTSDLGGH
jgi:hypothetical protein